MGASKSRQRWAAIISIYYAEIARNAIENRMIADSLVGI
jgi:hypothetical protein